MPDFRARRDGVPLASTYSPADPKALVGCTEPSRELDTAPEYARELAEWLAAPLTGRRR